MSKVRGAETIGGGDKRRPQLGLTVGREVKSYLPWLQEQKIHSLCILDVVLKPEVKLGSCRMSGPGRGGVTAIVIRQILSPRSRIGDRERYLPLRMSSYIFIILK